MANERAARRMQRGVALLALLLALGAGTAHRSGLATAADPPPAPDDCDAIARILVDMELDLRDRESDMKPLDAAAYEASRKLGDRLRKYRSFSEWLENGATTQSPPEWTESVSDLLEDYESAKAARDEAAEEIAQERAIRDYWLTLYAENCY